MLSQAVILVIDALRYDFIDPSVHARYNSSPRMPFVRDLLSARDGRALLLPFVADPPTVTFQRIKGLTTGSLPTLLDIGSSFTSPEITEDTWVAQLAARGRYCTKLLSSLPALLCVAVSQIKF